MEPEPGERKLSAILSFDVYGYSRLMGTDETDTLKRLSACREIIFGLITDHRGRVANTAGDAVLADFASVKDAVAAASDIQGALFRLNESIPEDRKMRFRVGVNLGDVVVKDGDIFGDGVNVAARIQALADPGGICVSGSVYEQVRRGLEPRFVFLGNQKLKNIDEPVKVYKMLVDADAAAGEPSRPDAASRIQGDSRVVAVLPFDNLSSDIEQTYFCDGLTEDLITGLASITELTVPARNTMFTYKGKAVDVRQIGKELGATHVVEGSVRKAGSHIRVNVQLINASNGNHIWARRYDRELTDIFEIQDDIVRGIVTELDVRLAHGEQARAWRRSTKNAEAYDLFWQAADVHYRNLMLTAENLMRSLSLIERALSLDPNFASALILKGLVLYFTVLFGYERDTNTTVAESLAAADAALRIDDGAPDAHSLKGFLLLQFTDQRETARQEMERGLSLDPLLPDSNLFYAYLWFDAGDFQKGLSFARRAEELWKGDPPVWFTVAEVVGLTGLKRLQDARMVIERNLERGSSKERLLPFQIAVLVGLGLLDEARAARDEFARLVPDFNFKARLAGIRRYSRELAVWFAEQYRNIGLE